MEVFSYEKYRQALWKGVKYPMLCKWDEDSLNEYWGLLQDGRVQIITIPVSLLFLKYDQLKALHQDGISIFVFTSNDLKLVGKYINKYVAGFYTDNIIPAQLYKQ